MKNTSIHPHPQIVMAAVTPVTSHLSPGQSRATTLRCTRCGARAPATGGPGPRGRRSRGGPGCRVGMEEVARRSRRSRRRSWRRRRLRSWRKGPATAAPPGGCWEKDIASPPQTSGASHHHHRGRRPRNNPMPLGGARGGGEGGGGGGTEVTVTSPPFSRLKPQHLNTPST